MELDRVIHQPARLQIMASLTALHSETEVDFRSLGTLLKLTDGNLGSHLNKLEAAGYVKVTKTFVKKKPKTYLSATPRGRLAFEEHVAALRQILDTPPTS